ncbi:MULTISPECIES: NAD/NADP-dependent octopine/nopaline dehydrogenase family protein [Bradyrhizobium]|uniref:NAD/NADP-dependent octopine/nopaline dehydrogenase family protein n=1 Tax=Bradyrhizobium TaxID=374 RepID=UPI000F544780|nr:MULTISPECIES: NAD/NADP-dependent octopine/nopaline dehydrogenase family protein [Bradyrhizobium]RQH05200.1 NADP transhydrogenase subunit alpha [Bradyrhizobium sp. RP6]UWU93623.1 NAD/NADP octopine/nopaline dehydrogenase family protein [Bradyrhizobium sp. CB1015]
MKEDIIWAIIGGGHGGQSMAGHLAIMGCRVRLYNRTARTIEEINKLGGINIDGALQGFGGLELATTDIGEALAGAHVVVVVTPATAHAEIATKCASHLVDGQIVFLHPGAMCGAIEFREILRNAGCTANIPVAESNHLLYACRSAKPGYAEILAIKKDVLLATLPANKNNEILELLNEVFPQIRGARNVLETSLSNGAVIMHPAPTIFNLSMIESQHDWLYYSEGITPTIGAFAEDIDQERVALGKSFGFDLPSVRELYRLIYGVQGESLSEICRKNPAYEKIRGQKDLRTRYILEDIPFGLVPMIELGRMQGLSMSRMKLIAELGQYLLKDNSFLSHGRTLANLGLGNMTSEEFAMFVQTGERPVRHRGSPAMCRHSRRA